MGLGRIILILIVLYFVIKWAVKEGLKEAYEDITGYKTAETIKIEEMIYGNATEE